MSNIHPFLTHFPIALLTVGVVFDTMSVLLKHDRLEFVGRWSQLLGTISLAATVASGLIAKGQLTIQLNAQEFFGTHQQIAFVATALASSLLLWRISNRLLLPSNYRRTYLLLSSATVALIWIGAWYGGELVYRFGVGIQTIPR
jgi:uncharacterized membrane protein